MAFDGVQHALSTDLALMAYLAVQFHVAQS